MELDKQDHKIDLEKHTDQLISDSLPSNNSNEDWEEETVSKKQRLFAHPFSFHGRIRRLEYCLSIIIFYIWYFFFSIASEEGEDTDGITAIFILLTIIPAYWFILAQGCKRCHDRNNSGWYQIIPFYGLWMCFADGDEEENDYGKDPKGRNLWNSGSD